MSRKQVANSVVDQQVEDEELRLDNEFREEAIREVEEAIKEDEEIKTNVFIYSDMKKYIYNNGISNQDFFKNLSVDFIKTNF